MQTGFQITPSALVPTPRPTSTNAFGHLIPTFAELLQYSAVRQYILHHLGTVIEGAFHTKLSDQGLVNQLLEEASAVEEPADLITYEQRAHELLQQRAGTTGGEQAVEALKERAGLIFKEIGRHVGDAPSQILDLGCGDGRVSELLRDAGHSVTLADVYKHTNIASASLPFMRFKGPILPFTDRSFDTVLILTVLHHCSDPHQTFSEAVRVIRPGGRIIVIESVYGILPENLSPSASDWDREFARCPTEAQRYAGIFFDHLYNRIFHYSDDPRSKVNVPYNFQTPEMWQRFFESHGCVQQSVEFLGIDLPRIVPEFHTLHVLMAPAH